MPTTRREFLRQSALTTLGLGLAGPSAVRASFDPAALASGQIATGEAPPIIVAVFLDGGNDGLNTIVPLDEYDRYRKLRPTLALPKEDLIPLPRYTSRFGVNPVLQPFVDMFQAGQLAIINGVGPPLQTLGLFNHEGSRGVFETARIDGGAGGNPTGWIGRAATDFDGGDLPWAFDFGARSLLLVGGERKPLVLPSLASLEVEPAVDTAARSAAYRLVQRLGGDLSEAAEQNRLLRVEGLEFSTELRQIATAHDAASPVSYPSTRFGRALADCAALISARRGVRAMSVSIGSFDTHANQNRRSGPNDTRGFHAGLLADLGSSVSAFCADLEATGNADGVLVLVYSEFGRRGPENPSGGTDHGLGSTMFVIGKSLRGGVFGEYPSLDELALGGNLDVRVDFRSVYATILARHFDTDPEPILGGTFPLIGFLR